MYNSTKKIVNYLSSSLNYIIVFRTFQLLCEKNPFYVYKNVFLTFPLQKSAKNLTTLVYVVDKSKREMSKSIPIKTVAEYILLLDINLLIILAIFYLFFFFFIKYFKLVLIFNL